MEIRIARRGMIGGILGLTSGAFGRSPRTWAQSSGTPAPQPERFDAERGRLTLMAQENAFGADSGLEPDLGFGPNRTKLAALYDYYGSLSDRDPERFLWAGLARLAGASVIAGLDVLVADDGIAYPDPSPLTTSLTDIANAVFTDLAWLHEAFSEDPRHAISLGAAHDAATPARASYAVAWTLISEDNADAQADGNRALLANEQFSIVQPVYDRILADPDAGPMLRATGALVPAVHPHHTALRETVPGGDLTDASDRWRWIAGPGGMWETWIALPLAERRRVIEPPLEDLVARRW